MIIKMFATLCHMAMVSPSMPAVEFCLERLVASQDVDVDPKNKVAVAAEVNRCYRAVQPTVAATIREGETMHEFRCTPEGSGVDQPKGSA